MNIEVKNDEMLGRANTRTVIVDNIEIQTSLPAIEIADLPQKLAVLEKENQELKQQLHESSLEIQHLIEQDIECPSNCSKLKELNKSLKASRRVAKYHLNRELDLKEANKSISKGLQKVSFKRNKWKKRYYTERGKNQELQEQLSNSHQINAQQKEFMAWLEKEIKEADKTIEMLCYTNSCRIPYVQSKKWLLKEILKKYKEIIGVKDE